MYQIYSGNHHFFGRERSGMAEFTSNPDDRPKRERSYQLSMTILQMRSENDRLRAKMVRVNRERNRKELETFRNVELFNNLLANVCDEMDIDEETALNFLSESTAASFADIVHEAGEWLRKRKKQRRPSILKFKCTSIKTHDDGIAIHIESTNTDLGDKVLTFSNKDRRKKR